MKRGAEKQLSKDMDDEDEEVSEPGEGFRKAEESVIATRKIRGLPKRVSASQSTSGATTPEASSVPAPAPKFGGFGGFGGAGVNTSSFSFAAPSKPAAATPAPVISTFPSSTPSFTATPALSSSASSAAKTFASFLGSPAESKPTTNGVHVQNGSTTDDEKLKAETTYYRALRGLNVSFVDAITKAVESDPFLDLAEVLEKYKSLRSKAKQDYDDSVKKAGSSNTTGAAPPTTPSPFSFGASKSAPSVVSNSPFALGTKPTPSSAQNSAPTMPAPPTAFAGFSLPPTTASTGGSFKPQLDLTKSSSFAFGSSPSEGGSTTASLQSAFTFGTSSTSKNASSFGASSKPAESSAFPSSTPSVFSSNLFSNDSSKESGKEDNKTSSSSTNAFSGGFTFGGDKPSTSTPTKSPFGGVPSSKPSSFAFGSSTGSIGNPIGFSFGSPPKTPDEPTLAPASSSKFTPFSFGGPSIQPKTADSSEAGGDTDASSRAETPAEDAPPLVGGSSAHDMEGEGEEDEQTKYEVRTKVYKLTKKQDGEQAWTDVGIGMLRVKAHNETGNRRLLLRNSSTGKITINFNVYKGMNPTVAKNVVSFMGHDEGHAVPFRLRVKTGEQADELKNALDREIEFVKSKSSD